MQIQKILIETRSCEDFYQIAKNATPNISFFGNRYITVKDSNGVNYDGELPINALAEHFMEVIEKSNLLAEKKGTTIRDRNIELIRNIFVLNDKQVNSSNFFTYYLALIRDFFRVLNEGLKGIRFYWRY